MALVGLHDLLPGRRLAGKFQWRAGIGHDRIDDEFIVADVEPDRALGVARVDDCLDGLLDGEFDPVGDVPPRTPDAGVALDEVGNPRYVGRAGIDRRSPPFGECRSGTAD